MATILTQVGEEWIVDKLDDVITGTTEYVGWGSGAGTAAKADTTLFFEETETRQAATRSQVAPDKLQWVATMTADADKVITEAGLFSAATEGILIIHGDFTGIALTAGDKIEFTFELEIT